MYANKPAVCFAGGGDYGQAYRYSGVLGFFTRFALVSRPIGRLALARYNFKSAGFKTTILSDNDILKIKLEFDTRGGGDAV